MCAPVDLLCAFSEVRILMVGSGSNKYAKISAKKVRINKQEIAAALGLRLPMRFVRFVCLLIVNQGCFCSPCDERVSAETSLRSSLRLDLLRES